MLAIHRILVPVDFSPCAAVAARYAIFLARQFQADLAVAHVISASSAWSPTAPFRTPNDAPAMRFAEALEALNDFVLTLDPEHSLDVEKHLEVGDPTDRLMRLASDGRFDLIVMGTHGRTGMSYLLLGSLAQALVRHAPCPVLTLRAEDYGSRMRSLDNVADLDLEEEIHA